VYNVGAHPGWTGKTVTKMRFDPASLANTDFAIDWIRASDGRLDDRLNFGFDPATNPPVSLRFYGGAGLTYRVESSTNLVAGPWSVLDTLGPLPMSGWQTYPCATNDAAGQRFFRVRISP
ncbi:MAG: hypothetical protein ACTHKU_08580, partial [Verrucomicrobiota bacterium]